MSTATSNARVHATFRPTILALVIGVVCGICVWKPISWIEENLRLTWTKAGNVSHGGHAVTVIEMHIKTPVKFVPLNCRDNSTLHLVFTVMSSPDNYGATKRSLVRGSWPRKDIYKPSPPAVDITVKFVLGTKDLAKEQLHKLTAERDKFKDILLLPNHHDIYSQLTEKVRQTVQWADKNLQFDYLIKTDDDVVIRLDKMVDALRKMHCPARLFWGHPMHRVNVLKTGKWKETKWNTCLNYLPYYSGTGYVMGRQVVKLVLRYSEHLLHFTCEDVSMGFWLAPYKITRHDDSRFHLSRTCSRKAIQAHHHGNVKTLKRALQAVLKKGKMC